MFFEYTQVYNIEGAMRGMRFPYGSKGDKEKDKKLALNLINASSVNADESHCKFLRQILVSVDITAPRYWWHEMDTYKVGTTSNSSSTMHMILGTEMNENNIDQLFETNGQGENTSVWEHLHFTVLSINEIKEQIYSSNEDKLIQIKKILPESFREKRHWTANYAVLRNICKQREHHVLPEWHKFIEWMSGLPYSEFIAGA